MQIDFFTIKALCQRYGCTPITIRRWIAQGLFPAPLRIGRRKVFWPVDVIRAHEAQAMTAANRKPTPTVETLVPDGATTS
jgi:predicted DNA-binding transcriptional regulator AlpA